VQSGAAAGAYRTLLTHFSQRYPKIPVVDQNFQVGTQGQEHGQGRLQTQGQGQAS
jgi:ribonuclease BN (tRNA processing enzyme)